ncbi:MAG: serine O-acetyltransferase [Gemmatimonadaceae bacterium]|nr:serine O-acetyltransferase [Gemmatimonadaceae bacterium]
MNSSHDDAAAARATWRALIDALKAERSDCAAPRPVRAMADEVARASLAVLFAQFAHPSRLGAAGVEAEAAHLEAVLRAVITPLVPEGTANDVVATFLGTLPAVRDALLLDAQAITSGDPAAGSLDEVIIAYPGFLATAIHRVSHELYKLQVPLFPRVLSEWAHRETGIDIHPGAEIGAGFAIDHGTGVVIGETSTIGDRVRIYQGVTLGALAVSKKLANRKRHPTIGDDVVIYANATILGGNTVVGDGSVIGGNVWLTTSVPPRSVVQFQSTVEKRQEDDGIEWHI